MVIDNAWKTIVVKIYHTIQHFKTQYIFIYVYFIGIIDDVKCLRLYTIKLLKIFL